uniref:Ammonium transporter n=1 Tax=Clytia hemisphaerica TaxID=252671 RepID=A0A069DMW4_9CNID
MNLTTSAPADNPFGGSLGGEAIDALWVIMATFIIFTMQSGFGLLESGIVSRKSESNVMVKNVLDVCLGGMTFWLFGFGFIFGPDSSENVNKFSGTGHWAVTVDVENEAATYTQMFFHLSFSTAATTIVSGAVAERVHLPSYMIFAAINTGFIYVFPAHWAWGGGWLSQEAFFDFAGSSVVHMAGGIAALAAAIILGPRHGRFDTKGAYGMSSPTNVILGTFFLWWGWIGFNCGSTFAVTGGGWKIASKTAVVTMNGAMAGGLSAVFLSAILYLSHRRKYILDITFLASGILGGLVGVTACAPIIRPWEGLFLGFVGGMIANGVNELLIKLKIDDPVGAFGVHYAAGLWSMIATGFFAEKIPGIGLAPEDGVFKGGNGGLLAWNLAGCLAITLWSGGLATIVFLTLKYTIGIRMSLDHELKGSDAVEHNIHEVPKPQERNHALGKTVEYPERESPVHVQMVKANNFAA